MILLFDTETTGLPKNWKAPVTDLDNWPRLVQLAYLVYDFDGNLIHSCNEIIKPNGFTIPNEASKVHGITTEIANQRGCKIEEVFELFSIHLRRAKVVVAHNMAYDEKIIGSELIRLGFENTVDSKEKICTMESTVDLCKINGPYGYKWPKLKELYKFLFNHDFDGAHDALADIQATARCFWELSNRNIIKINKVVDSKSEEMFQIKDKILKINEAIKHNIKLRIIYQNAENEISTRILSNVNYSNKVLSAEEIQEYLIDDNFITGFCHKRNEIRTFKIVRIIELSVLKKAENINVSEFENDYIVPIKTGSLFNFCCWEIKTNNSTYKFFDYHNLMQFSYQNGISKIEKFCAHELKNGQEYWNSWRVTFELNDLGYGISNYSIEFKGNLKLNFSNYNNEFQENYSRLFPYSKISMFCGILIFPINELFGVIGIGHTSPPDGDDFGTTFYEPVVFIDAYGKLYNSNNKCNEHHFFDTYPTIKNITDPDEDDLLPF